MKKLISVSALAGALLLSVPMTNGIAAANPDKPLSAPYVVDGFLSIKDADDFTNVAPGQKGVFQPDFVVIEGIKPTGTVPYRSSDPDIFEIDANGNWSAKKEGVVRISTDWSLSEESWAQIKKKNPNYSILLPDMPYHIKVTVSPASSVYRLYNPNTGEHLYSPDREERMALVSKGWNYESISWLNAKDHSCPVVRLYNPDASDHHYTANPAESSMLVKAGWKKDGVALYTDSEDQIPIYRLYNPNAASGAHHFTASQSEYKELEKLGWKGEGIAFYTSSESRLPDNDPLAPIVVED